MPAGWESRRSMPIAHLLRNHWSPLELLARTELSRSSSMLKWALIFFVISIIAGFFGFSGVSAGAATIAKWLFFAALAVFVILLALGLLAGEVLF